MQVSKLFLFLFSFSVVAAENSFEGWTKVKLTHENIMKKTIFHESIAQSWIKAPNHDETHFVPPIYEMSEVVQGDPTQQGAALLNKILKHLEIDATDANTRARLRGSPFLAGVNLDLKAKVYEYQSIDKRGASIKYITCVALIGDHGKIRALYSKSAIEDFANCGTTLMQLSKAKFVYE